VTVRIRPAAPKDAEALLRLIHGLNEHVGAETGKLSREILMRDALGEAPKFELAVAERAGEIAGYAAWCDAYETEHAVAGLYMIDLYVDPAHRRNGIARRLVAAVSAASRARGLGFVWWTAVPSNKEAAAFYRSLGCHSEPVIAHALYGDPFDRLADEA
jgi:ribosomal protein S18 acetylase RimI-like enzyme